MKRTVIDSAVTRAKIGISIAELEGDISDDPELEDGVEYLQDVLSGIALDICEELDINDSSEAEEILMGLFQGEDDRDVETVIRSLWENYHEEDRE